MTGVIGLPVESLRDTPWNVMSESIVSMFEGTESDFA